MPSFALFFVRVLFLAGLVSDFFRSSEFTDGGGHGGCRVAFFFGALCILLFLPTNKHYVTVKYRSLDDDHICLFSSPPFCK